MIDAGRDRRALEEGIAQQQAMLAEIANVINTAYDIEQKTLKRIERGEPAPLPGERGSPEWSAEVTIEVQAMWAIWDEHALNLWVLMEAIEGRRGPTKSP